MCVCVCMSPMHIIGRIATTKRNATVTTQDIRPKVILDTILTKSRPPIINCWIVLKFCTEHGSITAVLCAKFQNDLATKMGIVDERDFARFKFKMRFGRISYIGTAPRCTSDDTWEASVHGKDISCGNHSEYYVNRRYFRIITQRGNK